MLARFFYATLYPISTLLLTFVAIMNTNNDHTPQKVERDYYKQMRSEKAYEIYVKVINKLMKKKLYRDPSYRSAQLAADLKVPPRYITTAVAVCTGGNYRSLVNGMRLRDACNMLSQSRFAHMSAEDIGLLSGFASRQAFYIAFNRVYKCTPLQYREQHQQENEGEKDANNQ